MHNNDNNNNGRLPRGFVYLAVLTLWLVAATAWGQSEQNAGQRPVYLDIQSVGGVQHSSLSDDLIADMAREKLSSLDRSSIVMGSRTLPPDAYVLRILYVVHRQSRSDTVALAASASTQLLRTSDDDHDGVIQTYSIYSGLQQILVEGTDESSAGARVRDAFKRQLKARISVALLNVSLY